MSNQYYKDKFDKLLKDLPYLIVIIVINPVLITFFFNTKLSLPDTFLYIREAQSILSDFQFYTGSYGHIDTSYILPPLYPALIAILMKTGLDGLQAAVLISQLSGILFSIVIFIYISRFCNSLIALISTLTIHLTFVYFNIFTLAITEPLFLLLFSILLLIMAKTNNAKPYIYVLAGVLSGLLFLCREIGITVLAAVLIFFLIDSYTSQLDISRLRTRIIVVIISFSVITVPFYILRYIQTGQAPMTRVFKLNKYHVYTDDANLISYIEKIKSVRTNNYNEMYQKRRALMMLLDDGSEFIGRVEYKSPVKSEKSTQHRISSFIYHYLSSIRNNIFNLVNNTGVLIFIIFLFISLMDFFYIYKKKFHCEDLIPLFIIIYLMTLSYFTSEIMRYIYLLVPLILVYIVISGYRIFTQLFIDNRRVIILLALLFPAVTVYSSPGLFFQKQIFSKSRELDKNLAILKGKVKGEPVFSLYPTFAYSVGGEYRQMPNDSLEKIRTYAKYTGVNWILIVDSPEIRNLLDYWPFLAGWITNHEYLTNNTLVTYCCGFHDRASNTDLRLFKFNED